VSVSDVGAVVRPLNRPRLDRSRSNRRRSAETPQQTEARRAADRSCSRRRQSCAHHFGQLLCRATSRAIVARLYIICPKFVSASVCRTAPVGYSRQNKPRHGTGSGRCARTDGRRRPGVYSGVLPASAAHGRRSGAPDSLRPDPPEDCRPQVPVMPLS